MKRIDRMTNMRMQIDNIFKSMKPTQCNEIQIAATLANLAISNNVPAHIYNNGKREDI